MSATLDSTAAAPTTRSLETVALSKAFGGVKAVDGATVTFQHGRINALIGPNGSGKTTFFNCVTGMIKPDSGTVTYRGDAITRKAPHRIAAAGIGRSFQLCRVFPRMTVLENMLVGVRPAGMLHRLAGARNDGDVAKAREFYGNVLGLQEIPRPAFDFPGSGTASTAACRSTSSSTTSSCARPSSGKGSRRATRTSRCGRRTRTPRRPGSSSWDSPAATSSPAPPACARSS